MNSGKRISETFLATAEITIEYIIVFSVKSIPDMTDEDKDKMHDELAASLQSHIDELRTSYDVAVGPGHHMALVYAFAS